MPWQAAGAAAPGVLWDPWEQRVPAVLPTSPVLLGTALGTLSPAGLEAGAECEGESLRVIPSLLGGAAHPRFPSWLLFVASFCQDVPSTVRPLLLWEMDVTISQDDSIFSSGVA